MTIPHTSEKGAAGRLPGWNEQVKSAWESSIFWHDIWKQCGKPHDGVVADVMRRARATYHYANSFLKKNEYNIVNERLADMLVNNHSTNFWQEVKHIRGCSKCSSCYVGGIFGSDNISEHFAGQYQHLLHTVAYDDSEMSQLYIETCCSIDEYNVKDCVVNTVDVMNAASQLKPGKSDGDVLSSDYFLHACDDLYAHIALLF